MDSTEQDFTNQFPPSTSTESRGANYFVFFDKPSAENLAANRSGILSTQQLTALQAHISSRRSGNIIFSGMLILTAIFLIFLFWMIDRADGSLSLNAWLINASLIIVILGIFAGYMTGDWFVYSMGDDLENPVVESATGRVEWDGKRYRMRTDSRSLRSLRQGVVLPPGDYRFYYLPHTGLVVMAEEVVTGQRQPESLLLRTLASANGFSLDELKSNHDGRLSKHQENELVGIASFTIIIGLGGAVAFGVLIPRILRELSATGLALALIIALVVLLRLGWSATLILSDVWHGGVSNIEGPVSKKARRSRYSHSYYYVSGPNQFQVSKTAYNALIEGRTYRIFYVPRSKRLVSIEHA